MQDFDSLVPATQPLPSIPSITETISTLLDFTPAELKALMLIYRANEAVTTTFLMHENGSNEWGFAANNKRLGGEFGSAQTYKTAVKGLLAKELLGGRLSNPRMSFQTKTTSTKGIVSPNRKGRIFLQNLKKITPDSLTATISPLSNQFVWSPEHGIGVVENVKDNEAQITFFPDMEEKIILVTLDNPDSPLYKFY